MADFRHLLKCSAFALALAPLPALAESSFVYVTNSAGDVVDVVNASTGRSFNTEVVFKQDVITGRYGTGFALGLLAKDVAIAAGLAEAVGVDAPACQLVHRRWAEAAEGLGFSADHSEAHKRWWPVDLSARAADPEVPG